MLTPNRRFTLGAIGLTIGVLGGVYFLGPTHGRPRVLAILPFQNLKGDTENDFLGFSLADAVITRLGAVRSLTVRASSDVERYRNQSVDLRRAAADLHVDTILTGTFLRDGDVLRITSQLVDVQNQKLIWKGAFDVRYDRLLIVQDNVAREIVEKLQLSLSPGEAASLEPKMAVDPLAYEYYLRGVDLYSRSEFPLAIKMLRRSADLDAGHALTWAHLGRALTASASFEFGGRDEYAQAHVAYQKALSLQPNLIDAQIYTANLLTDTGQAERAVPLLRQTLKTNPRHAEAHWELGYAYRFGGLLNESAAECERARQLDPGVKLSSSALNAYLYLGQYDKFLKSLPADNDSALILFYRGFGEYHRRNAELAASYFDAAFDLRPSMLQARLGKALSAKIRGQDRKALDLLREMEAKAASRGVGDPEATYKMVEAYAILGEKDSALRALAMSVAGGFFAYPYFISDPLLESLRGEPQFQRILAEARRRHEAFRQSLWPGAGI